MTIRDQIAAWPEKPATGWQWEGSSADWYRADTEFYRARLTTATEALRECNRVFKHLARYNAGHECQCGMSPSVFGVIDTTRAVLDALK